MCGIAGFWSPAAPGDATALCARAAAMAATLAHRGPDDAGAWADPGAGLAFGHQRLSIIDLSAAGHQPMVSASGRLVLSYNGEIYNYRALRDELAAAGHAFQGNSDTEVLLAAIEAWGIRRALERLNGMFAFALWDRPTRTLTLARDRLGQKPVYYGRAGGAFVFASELKALRRHPDFDPAIDEAALALYLRFAAVPAPWSIYRGVRKLEPGHLFELDIAALRGDDLPASTPYWSAVEVARDGLADPFEGPPDASVDVLDTLLRDAVRHCLEADVPLGAFLSGGIDSSTVVACMQAERTAPVRTFTIGFHEQAYDEAQWASRVARHLGTDHTELYVSTAEAQATIPRLAQIYDEPFADSSQIPTYLVSRLARERVTVTLSGDGGDELFGGYNRYQWGRSIGQVVANVPAALRRGGAALARAVPPPGWDAAFATVTPLLPRRFRYRDAGQKIHKLAELLAARDRTELYLFLLSQWHAPQAVLNCATEPATTVHDAARWPALGGYVEDMMALDATGYLPNNILVKLDRASMAVSLESRVPLLDHRLFAFAWRLPPAVRFRDGRTKWPLRQVLRRYLPDALIERPKMGFGVPIGAWLRAGLRDWAEDLLAEHRLRDAGHFDVAAVRRTWREHLSGTRNWEHRLWAVLMFETWRDGMALSAPSERAPAPTVARPPTIAG